MNILIVTEYFPESEKTELTGGVEARSFYLGKELAKRHKVMVLCSWQKDQKREDTIFGIKVIRCGSHHPYTNAGSIISRLKFVKSVIKRGKKLRDFDIIDGHNFLSYLPAYYVGKYHKIPKIATYHETWIGQWIKNKGWLTGILGDVWERFVLNRKWNKFISVSNFTKNRLIKYGVNEKKIEILSNGIDLKRIEQIKAKKHKTPTICYFGRLSPQKDVTTLIKAVGLVQKKKPQVQCVIIGDGPVRKDLENLSQKLGLTKTIKFLGFIENYDKMMEEIKRCHLFVSPSILEGFGITVLEAMACGLPCVVSNIKPYNEITKGGQGCLIFKRRDYNNLSRKILILLKNKKIYNQKIREQKVLINDYQWKNLSKNLEKIYTNLK